MNTKEIDPRQIRNLPKYDPADPFLLGLAASIKEHGIWHPPAVKDNDELVFGKKRIAASIIAGLTTIQCSVVPSDQSEEYYKVLALHENLKRKNLPWHEEILMEKELHDLHIKEFGQKSAGRPSKTKSGWGLRDTAEELEMSFGMLSEDLRMAEAILADPNLRRIEDRATAKKVIFENYKRITQELDSGGSSTTAEVNVVHCGGAETILQMYPNNTFDACITDPPWLCFKEAHLTKDAFTLDVFKQVYRVLKANAFMYAFLSTLDFWIYKTDLAAIGFNIQEIPLIWIKEGVLTQGSRSWEYQRNYEFILLAVKGSPALTAPLLSAVFSCKVVHSSKLRHPNEKPPEVIKRILDHCTYENGLVLDPFAGSGVVGSCCKDMRRDYVLVEKDRHYHAQIVERLRGKS